MASRQPTRGAVSRIRIHRRSALLAQRELALLIGLTTQHACSELETGMKRPGLDVALACAMALGVPVDELFPELATHIARQMLARALTLHDVLKSDAQRAHSADYIGSLIDRLKQHDHS